MKNFLNAINTKTQDIKKHKSEELEKIEQLYGVVDNIKNDRSEFRLETKSVFIFWLMGALVAYFSYVVFQSLDFLYLILTGYIISMAMESIVEAFQKSVPRIVAILLAYIIMIAILLSGFLLIVPFVVSQSSDIIKLVIDKITTFQTLLQTHGLENLVRNTSLLPGYFKGPIVESLKNPQVYSTIQNAIQQNTSQIISYGSSYVSNVGGIVVNTISGFFSIIFNVVLVFSIAIFFSLEKDGVIKFISVLSGRKEFTHKKLNRLYKKLGFWLKGQLILGFFIFSTVLVLLLSLNLFGIKIPNVLTLALIAGLTEFIPYVGPILGAVPGILVGTTSYGFTGLIAVGIVYAIVQWTENNVLVPLVMNQALGVSPLVIFIAMLIGGSVLGFLGVLLSVPIAVIVTLIFEDMMKKG